MTGGEQPEEVDLQTARSALLGILGDFDFQTEGDKSRAVASFIWPALKLGGFLKYRVPADVAQADQSQAGKGYRQNIIAALYNEKLSIVANRKGGVGSLDETFSHQLLEGRPFIQFDNLRGKFDSQTLESFSAADGMFPCRTPFRVIVNVRAADYFIFMTSNGLETTRDLANRSAIIRIRKRPPEYSFKKYTEGDLLAHVRARQPFYLGCVFSVIRAWHKAGKLRTNEACHDFKEWVQIMDWIVQNLLGLAPLMDGHLEAQQMVSNPDMVMLRQVCNAMDRGDALGEPQTSLEIAEVCEGENIEIPGLRNTGDLMKGARQIGSCLGRLFDRSNSMEVEGFRVERQVFDKKLENGNYMKIKKYLFEKTLNAQTLPPAPAPENQQVQSKPAKVEGQANVEYPHDFRRDGVRGLSFANKPHKCAGKFQNEMTKSAGDRALETTQPSTSPVP